MNLLTKFILITNNFIFYNFLTLFKFKPSNAKKKSLKVQKIVVNTSEFTSINQQFNNNNNDKNNDENINNNKKINNNEKVNNNENVNNNNNNNLKKNKNRHFNDDFARKIN